MSDTPTKEAVQTVTFDRIGRTHNPPPFEIDARFEEIYRLAKPYLRSSDIEIVITDDGQVLIFCGFHSGATGRISPWPVAEVTQ